jgi:hypothetical protein
MSRLRWWSRDLRTPNVIRNTIDKSALFEMPRSWRDGMYERNAAANPNRSTPD